MESQDSKVALLSMEVQRLNVVLGSKVEESNRNFSRSQQYEG